MKSARTAGSRPTFPGTVPDLWVLKSSVPSSCKIPLRTQNILGYFQVINTRHFFLIAYEHFDFPTEGENICRGRTAINQPLTGRNRTGRERERCVD